MQCLTVHLVFFEAYLWYKEFGIFFPEKKVSNGQAISDCFNMKMKNIMRIDKQNLENKEVILKR